MHMTPTAISLVIESYVQNQTDAAKQMDISAWYIGGYVHKAINASFDGKKCPYPNEPISQQKAEEERQQAIANNPDNVFLRLKIMQANDRLKRGKLNGEH